MPQKKILLIIALMFACIAWFILILTKMKQV